MIPGKYLDPDFIIAMVMIIALPYPSSFWNDWQHTEHRHLLEQPSHQLRAALERFTSDAHLTQEKVC